MMKYWIYEKDDKLCMDIQGAGKRGLSRSRLLKHVKNRFALAREWADEMKEMGYKNGDVLGDDVCRWAVVSEYRDDGKVSACIVDSKEPGRFVPKAGEYKDFDRYVDFFDSLEEAQTFLEEVENG